MGKCFSGTQKKILLHLQSLTDLLNVRANKLLIMLMIEFWEITIITFLFTDYEIMSMLEEISYISDLPLAGKEPLSPCTTSEIGFL